MGLTAPGPWDENKLDPEVEAKVALYVDLENLPKGHIMHRIERGMQGLNIGIPTMNSHVDKYTYGMHQSRYYLIGADSAVGKTTIADFLYILNAYWQAKILGRMLHIFYYSFEISKEQKKLRWISFFVHILYGESLPADYIDGKITGLMLTAKHLTMVRYATVYVEEMMDSIVFVEDPVHPTRIFHDLIEGHYEKVGKVHRNKSSDPKKKGTISGWDPDDSQAITLLMMDHVALLAPEQGFDMKQTIDLMSKYIVTLRNIFSMTAVVVQQFNTEMTSFNRMNRKGDSIIAPQRIDFGDSRYTYRDANVVFGAIKPAIYDVDNYYGYSVKELKEYFVMLHLMKNRDGADHKALPLFIDPIAGFVKALPVPPMEIAMEDFLKEVTRLDKAVQFFTPKSG